MEGQRLRKVLLLIAVCGIVFAGNYAQYQVSALAHLTVARLGLTSAEFSAILFVPFVPAFLFGIPIGVVADHRGVRRLVFLSVCASCVASLLRCVCGSFVAYFAVSMLLGLGACTINATVLKVLSFAFGDSADRAMGLFYAAGSAGIAASLATCSMLGTETCAYIVATVMFAVFGLLWLAVAPPCEELLAASSAGPDAGASDFAALFSKGGAFAAVARIPAIWLVSIILGVAMASSTAYSGYLVSAMGDRLDPVTAGGLASFVTLGSIAGSIIGPFMRSRFRDYRSFLSVTSLVGAALMWAGQATLAEPSVVLMLLIGVFTAVAGPVVQSIPFTIPAVRGSLEGSAGGVVSTVSLGLTFVIPVLLSAAIGESYLMLLMGCAVLFGLPAMAAPLLPSPSELL